MRFTNKVPEEPGHYWCLGQSGSPSIVLLTADTLEYNRLLREGSNHWQYGDFVGPLEVDVDPQPDFAFDSLRPCPFCFSTDLSLDTSWVRCNDCHADGPMRTNDRDAAARAWNRAGRSR